MNESVIHLLMPFLSAAARADISSRTRRAMQIRVQEGRHPGKAPLGYKNAEMSGSKTIIIDSDKAELVCHAFRLVAGGVPYRTILKELSILGLRSNGDRELGVSSLHMILTNPFYMGRVRIGNEVVRGTHTPLVPESLFWRVQEQLGKKRCRPPKLNKHLHQENVR